jgi:hypothetical protein
MASDGKEVPILVDPKGYAGRNISDLLQQSVSPFTRVKIAELLNDISDCGLRTVLVVDALNECPEKFRAKLFEKIQAFTHYVFARRPEASLERRLADCFTDFRLSDLSPASI